MAKPLCLHDTKGERDSKVHALTYYVPGIRVGDSLTRSDSLLNQPHEADMIVSIL